MAKTRKNSHRKALFSLAFPFYASVFLSAFLLFQVQPMIGKYFLPWFGGGSSIWTTTILFFMVVLLFGYAYAYFLTKLQKKHQILIHLTLTVVISALLIGLFFFWSSPITPPLALRPHDNFTPVIQILTVLFLSVGLPYFLLSTTSSLLQKWFSQTKFDLSPYPLYSLSNAGSLLGLLAYPFLIEVVFPLHIQGRLWAGGFILFALTLAVCCYVTMHFARKKVTERAARVTDSAKIPVSKIQPVLWLLLPMMSAMILLSTTSQITQSVAPAPFLWIVPLGLYLLSFILCFSSKNFYWRNIYAILFVVLAAVTLYISLDLQSFIVNLSVYTAFIFVSFMLLHGELYKSRPAPEHLNLFYLLESFGSVLGGIFVGIIAPRIFNDFWEFYIAAFLVLGVAILVLITPKKSLLHPVFSRVPLMSKLENRLVIGGVLSGVIALVGFWSIYTYQDEMIAKTRNFYGLVAVGWDYGGMEEYKIMYNGRINHGGQYTSDELRRIPVSYFGPQSGIHYAMTLHPKQIENVPLRIGVTGLGVGTIASFGKSEDSMTFYEINPNAIDMAYDHFTYLEDSDAKIHIIPGDARITMQNQVKLKNKPLYDILVLDAFIDDAIPVHLMTKEAFAIYLQLLDPKEGILAVNISNRYLSLEGVVGKLAEEYGMGYAIIHSYDGENNTASASWVLLSFNEKFINHPDIAAVSSMQEKDLKKTQLWTDDYSNLFQALYFY